MNSREQDIIERQSAEVTELRDRITKLEGYLDTRTLERDALRAEQSEGVREVRRLVQIKTDQEGEIKRLRKYAEVESRDHEAHHDELARLRSAAVAVSDEWDAYIGSGDDEGHDDPVAVGEIIAVLRKALEVRS